MRYIVKMTDGIVYEGDLLASDKGKDKNITLYNVFYGDEKLRQPLPLKAPVIFLLNNIIWFSKIE